MLRTSARTLFDDMTGRRCSSIPAGVSDGAVAFTGPALQMGQAAVSLHSSSSSSSRSIKQAEQRICRQRNRVSGEAEDDSSPAAASCPQRSHCFPRHFCIVCQSIESFCRSRQALRAGSERSISPCPQMRRRMSMRRRMLSSFFRQPLCVAIPDATLNVLDLKYW